MNNISDYQFRKFLFNLADRKFTTDKVDVVLYKDGVILDKIDLQTEQLLLHRWSILEKCIELLLDKNELSENKNINPGFKYTGYSFDIEEAKP